MTDTAADRPDGDHRHGQSAPKSDKQSDKQADKADSKVIALISSAHFFSHFYIYLLPPLFPLLKAELGVSYAQLGLLLATFSGVTGLTQIPFGFLVDRIGARMILIVGLGVEGVAFLLMGFVGGFWSLFGLMLVAGAANGVYHPADYAILSSTVSQQRMGRAFSLHTFAGYAGFAVAAPVIVFLNLAIGWRYGLAACGVAGLAAMVFLMVWARHLDHPPKMAPKTPPKIPPKMAQVPGAAQSAEGAALLFSAPILLCLGFFTLLSLGSTGISSFLIVALNARHGTDLEAAALVLSAYMIAGAGGVLIGGFIADRTRRHNLVAAICFLATAVMIGLIGAVTMPLAALFVLMTLQGLMHGVIMPSRDMIVRSVTPDGAFGRVFGFVTSGFSIGGVLGPPVFGWILDHSDPAFLFYGIAAIMVCSTLTVFSAGRRPASWRSAAACRVDARAATHKARPQ